MLSPYFSDGRIHYADWDGVFRKWAPTVAKYEDAFVCGNSDCARLKNAGLRGALLAL